MSVSSSYQQVKLDDDHADAWEASVSAWVDGEAEMRADELDTPYGRQVWDTYHLIGDVLRSEELAVKPSDMFYARVSRAIDDEPPIVAPRARARRGFWRAGVSGVAVAAAVASVVWVALPYLTESGGLGSGTQVIASADDPALDHYVQAHRDIVGVGPVRQASFEVRP
ncbi:MAG: sigma-E factor negative regulatory protein [Burkholderiaceae bacterium]